MNEVWLGSFAKLLWGMVALRMGLARSLRRIRRDGGERDGGLPASVSKGRSIWVSGTLAVVPAEIDQSVTRSP
ncbi:hypothetical protein B0T22DRAFT_467509 [Podospora appendiculata]|uniref:Uncharacterized protein n=1 Tax=Podospora appendiculata TaxID=314037 RepID=A0AAE1CB60_9PEZI|nr:hypothetical protein B0T22DRAFT_467509 [Podospora appendiculata]